MSAEKRARELLAELARQFGQPEYAYHIGCGGVLDNGDKKLMAPILAALTPQWQDISTAPRDGTCILVRFHFLSVSVPQPGVMLVCWDEYYAKGGNGWDGVCDGFVDYHSGEPCHLHYGSPTHWLPLPAPPEGDA